MDAKIAVVVMALNLLSSGGLFFLIARKMPTQERSWQIFGENLDLWGGLFASHRVRYTDLCDLGRTGGHGHDVGHTFVHWRSTAIHCSPTAWRVDNWHLPILYAGSDGLTG
jgi:hypothetical protein